MKNLLEPERLARQRCGKTKQPQPLVTIVSALVCKHAILMASDSRTTNDDGTVRDDTQKIHSLKLSDGFGFLVGHSGNDDLAALTLEILSQLAAQSAVTDYRTCAELAEKAVSNLKDKLRTQFHGTSEELQKHFENHNFDLMVAHYWKSQNEKPRPCIFTLRFSLGVARFHRKAFVSIGCGSPLADFILSGFDLSKAHFTQGMGIAVYAIEQVKKFDLRCGGKTQLGVSEEQFANLLPVPRAILIDKDMVNDFASALVEINNEMSAQQGKSLAQVMDRVIKFMAPRVEKVKAESGGIEIGDDGSILPFRPPEQL